MALNFDSPEGQPSLTSGPSTQEPTPSPEGQQAVHPSGDVKKEVANLGALQGLARRLSSSDLAGDEKSSDKASPAPSAAAPSVAAPSEAGDPQDPDGVDAPPPPAPPGCCDLCRKKQRAAKSKFCGVCRSDVCAAKRGCEKSERGPWFTKLAKTGGAEFVDFMSSYVRANGKTRRKYSQRCNFDFARYEEAKRVQSSLRLGFKAIFMHKDRAIKHWMSRLSISRMEANDKWETERAKAKFVKHDGPNGEDRIPVKEDDFLIGEEGILEEKVKVKEHKRARYSEDVDNLMEEGLQGRAMSLDLLEKHGFSDFDNPDLVNDFLGGRAASEPVLPQQDPDQGAAEDSPKKPKTFDAATERISLQTKTLQLVDKAFSDLQQSVKEAEECKQKAQGETDVPASEAEALRLLKSRADVAKVFMGDYVAGVFTYEPAVLQANKEALEESLKSTAAELSDVVNSAPCFVDAVCSLVQAIKGISNSDEKKAVESDFKPFLNANSILKSAVKTASQKAIKFAKDRADKVEKAKRQKEQEEAKRLAGEERKRRAEESKLNKAAEKQGKVGSLFDIDFAKFSLRPLEFKILKNKGDVEKLDMNKPWAVKLDESDLPAFQVLLADAKVKASLDTFMSGFPGSAASMQGSKRFSNPVQDSGKLRAGALKELGIEDSVPDGLDAKMVAALGAVVTFGYGEDMMSFGLDTFQLPSLRVQTVGHRVVVMVALDKLCSFLKAAKKGENVSYSEVLDFLQTAQPTTIAAFLAVHPDAMCHCLLSKNTLAFVPGGLLNIT
ncbi:unnamed protein product, partial [Symbiodinium microadriaticum]